MMILGSCVYQPVSDVTATPSSFSAAITSGFMFISMQSPPQSVATAISALGASIPTSRTLIGFMDAIVGEASAEHR